MLRLKGYEKHITMHENSMFKGLPWQLLGPINVSGRMTDVEVVTPKGEHYTIYVAGASGGVWKTENEGTTWEPIFEHAASTSIGDIALAPSDQKIIWVGTGEANIFRSSMAGCGLYKSMDAGKTWTFMGLPDTHTVARIVVHPQNPDIVYAAAIGHNYSFNSQRGLFKTVDGGKTWQKILYLSDRIGCVEVIMHPEQNQTLFAVMWERDRKAWNHYGAGKNCGIYKSMDINCVVLSYSVGPPGIHLSLPEYGNENSLINDLGLKDWSIDFKENEDSEINKAFKQIHKKYL